MCLVFYFITWRKKFIIIIIFPSSTEAGHDSAEDAEVCIQLIKYYLRNKISWAAITHHRKHSVQKHYVHLLICISCPSKIKALAFKLTILCKIKLYKYITKRWQRKISKACFKCQFKVIEVWHMELKERCTVRYGFGESFEEFLTSSLQPGIFVHFSLFLPCPFFLAFFPFSSLSITIQWKAIGKFCKVFYLPPRYKL